MNIKYILLREKPVEMLTLLLNPYFDNKTSLGLSMETRTTFKHTLDVIKKYENDGLVTKERKGRQDELTLTTKGSIVAKHLQEIVKKLEG